MAAGCVEWWKGLAQELQDDIEADVGPGAGGAGGAGASGGAGGRPEP